ncbi:MAG: hypothetical protein ACPGD5_04405, partial [Salibacteraceae bacterium]
QYKFTNVKQIKDITKIQDVFVYSDGKGIQALKKANLTYEIIKDIFNFPNAELTVEFLNPKTRKSSLQERYIVKVEQQQ